MVASPLPVFSPPSTRITLRPDEIHVWCASLDLATHHLSIFAQTLSPDEHRKADQFRFERERTRFIAGRGILRKTLGRYSGLHPRGLRFCYGECGKPALAELSEKGPVSFNMAKSGGLALYGFTRGARVGIDIEMMRDVPEADQIVKQFFSARERSDYRRLPDSLRKVAFYNGWTRKEAFVKAIGDGLSMRLDSFDVSVVPGEPPKLLAIGGDPGPAKRWYMHSLRPAPGFVAALVTEKRAWRFRYWQWSMDFDGLSTI